MAPKRDGGEPQSGLDVQPAAELVEKAKAQGVSLVGPDGLLAGITRTVLQAALEAEMAEHLGFDEGERPVEATGNHRNGTSSKTVSTEVGPVRIDVPRDRAGEFTPQIVPKHARRVAGFDESIISLYAKGLTTGQIRAHLAEIYQVEVSRDLIWRVTDKDLDELRAWLADLMPATSLRACLDELPDTMNGRHPTPAERQIMQDADRRDPHHVPRNPARHSQPAVGGPLDQ